jgi:alkanesulfonate monooxygenase SsuD/methylene tetrahydromethanopterin reductase-like flavin-dependent oxidoreductase (luciferase family)
MKVGLFVTNQHTLDTDMVSALGDQIAMVRHARDRGRDSLMSGQHYLNEGDNKQLQLVPFLARLAAEAGEMTLGLGILLLNLHNPIYTAETVASLDIIARGNFIFGVGLGYRDVEFDAFGVQTVEPANYRERYAMLTGQRIDLCPICGGRMVEIGIWPRTPPTRRAPPRCDTS